MLCIQRYKEKSQNWHICKGVGLTVDQIPRQDEKYVVKNGHCTKSSILRANKQGDIEVKLSKI